MALSSFMAFLDIAQDPEKDDAIVVFAGREERKRLGVELFRSGYAPRLILSVARFEWRYFETWGLWSDGGLVDMVQTIHAPERHFFVHIEHDRASCDAVDKGRLGTMTEARAQPCYNEDGISRLEPASKRPGATAMIFELQADRSTTTRPISRHASSGAPRLQRGPVADP